jgi:hypothetical protein
METMPRFPRVSGRNLLRKPFNLPADFGAELNVVLICFTMDQQLEVNTWFDFLSGLKTKRTDIEVYELPTLPKFSRFRQEVIDYWMREGIPNRAVRTVTITLYVDVKEFAHALQLSHLELNYTLLIARDGRVLHSESGAFSDEKGSRLEERLCT